MFQFSFGDVKILNDFLSINDVDYVDCLVRGETMSFVTNTSDAFAEYKFPIHRSDEQKDEEFRIYKGLLKFITVRDTIVIEVKDGNVTMIFWDADSQVTNYRCSCLQQVVATTVYSNLIKMAHSLPEGGKVRLDSLNKMERVAAATTGVLSIEGGAVSVLTREGARAYQKWAGKESFSVTTKALSKLKKCNKEVLDFQDYLIAVNGSGFTVIVRKARLQLNEEYQLLVGKHWGAQFTANIDLGGLFRFLSKVSLDIDSIEIDLKEGSCVLGALRSEFFIPVRLTEVQTTGKLKKLPIPTMIIKKMLLTLGSSIFKIRVTKTFVELECGEFIVVW